MAFEIVNHPSHEKVRGCMAEVVAAGDTLVAVPQMLAEFVHVASDPKRFPQPLSIPEALRRAEEFWNGLETEKLYPTDLAMRQFYDWMNEFRLGRKRILDTLLAATMKTAEVTSLLTLNPSDFRIFVYFQFHPALD